MSKPFASQADLAEKKISFERLSDNAYAYAPTAIRIRASSSATTA